MDARKRAKKKLRRKLEQWLDSYDDVAGCVAQHGDLVELLAGGGGLCRIDNFLPTFVADGILDLLEDMEDWNVTAAGDDYTANNISHDFLSTKSPLLQSVFRVFTLLLPESLHTFSAAKYSRQGHIKPHDDRAYTQVRMEDGSIALCSRSIAVIYYLTKGWSAADGGALIDHEAPSGPRTYVPRYNSVVSFTIPRWHEVTPVVSERPRYSVFGWFLEPGKLYDLQLDATLPSHQQQPAGKEQAQQQQKKVKKKKKKPVQAEVAEFDAPPTAAEQQGQKQQQLKQQQQQPRRKKHEKQQEGQRPPKQQKQKQQ